MKVGGQIVGVGPPIKKEWGKKRVRHGPIGKGKIREAEDLLIRKSETAEVY